MKCSACSGKGYLIIPLKTQPIYEKLNCCYCNGSGERSWVDKVTRPYSKDFKYEVYLNQYHIETLTIRFSECIASYYNKQNS